MARLPRSDDTIAAIATAPGRGGIGIVRLSGPHSLAIAHSLSQCELTPRRATFATLTSSSGDALDDSVVIFYQAPHSFTGEDIIELQCHGSPVQLQVILRECLKAGARQAEPGEFSQRAFLNGKIDLTQAEAIADLIDSGSEAAARGALRSLNGDFSGRVTGLLEALIRLRVFVEAAIDFPEEEVDFIADSDVLEQLDTLAATVEETLAVARRGRALRDGFTLVIAGAPNVGKSSLLNRLAGADAAIVTDVAGTTRDLLREDIVIDGLPLHIVDTAGLRDADDQVEKEGIRRARDAMAQADHILLVVDESRPDQDMSGGLPTHLTSALPQGIPVTVVANKIDISNAALSVITGGDANKDPMLVRLSARTGEGIDLLREHLKACAGLADGTGSEFSARQRHIVALEDAGKHIVTARRQLADHASAELVAEDLRYAQDSLSAVTGEYTSDDLLGAIFSSFCIGK